MPNEIQPALMRAPEVATLLAISRPMVYKMTTAGQLPKPVEIGTCRRWRRPDIEAVAAGTWQPEAV